MNSVPYNETKEPDAHRDVFDSTDPEHTEAFLTAAYGTPVKIRGDREDYRFRHVLFGPGPFYLNAVDHTATTEIRTAPYPALAVIRMHRGIRTRLDLDQRFGPGDLALSGNPGMPYHSRYESTGYTVVVVPILAAAEAATNRPDDELGPPHFASLRPTSPAAARHWLHTVDYVTAILRANPHAMTQPLLNGATTRLLAATMLATFPNTWATTEVHHQDRVDATPTTLTRAIAFIDANPDLDIGVVDIARAAHVTVRAVQLAFRRHLDTTPMAYLRRVRLDRAHEQLRAASPDDGTTITQVAARWGYPDPSRFTARYRRAYGQPPSHTLRG
jgi:AraC-like DNA-binding protein